MTPEQQTIADLRQQLATAQDQFSQYLAGQVTLNDIAIKNGVISLEAGTELARVMAAQFLEIVKDAENYVEMSMVTNDGVKLCVTVQKCDGMTPHQLMRQAEQERDNAVAKMSEADRPKCSNCDKRCRSGELDEVGFCDYCAING